MKIIDRTPFRNEGGKVDIFGRLSGTLKFGTSWYARVQAQDAVTVVLESILGPNYILLRNCTLHDTEIDLPVVLIGPPGIFLVNVIQEQGVYLARDDEWGTISGNQLVPAAINQVQRTMRLGRVLQLYLERAGYKEDLSVEPILMAANPGTHIESVRTAVRIVMSDAMERFALSMNQAPAVLETNQIGEIARVILNGPLTKTDIPPEPVSPNPPVLFAQPESEAHEEPDPFFSPESLGFSFDLEDRKQASLAEAESTSSDQSNLEPGGLAGFEFTSDGEDVPAASSSKTRWFGLTKAQFLILGGILVFWLCAMVFFAIYIYMNY